MSLFSRIATRLCCFGSLMAFGVGWCPVRGQGQTMPATASESFCAPQARTQGDRRAPTTSGTLALDPFCFQQLPSSPLAWQQEPVSDAASAEHYSTALRAELTRLSPFDTKVGQRIRGVVPVEDVASELREDVRRLWERLLSPKYFPEPDQQVEWRAVLWSQVNWEPPRPHSKDPTPPRMNDYLARWTACDTVVVAACVQRENGPLDGLRITITLKGDERIQCQYPTATDAVNQKFDRRRNSGRVPVKDIDKQRLLNVLTRVFRFPWETKADFIVTWDPSPTSGGDLHIESSRIHEEGADRQWFDEVGLDLEDAGDAQTLSISASLPSRAPGG
ncbi:MAG: hypothetical protein IT449_17880 [Phycisphaerales bacterium]|nr:hypothetical protein [Phycisphaerales bacterium]